MASIGNWADICEQELGDLNIKENPPKEEESTPKESTPNEEASSTPEPKEKEEEPNNGKEETAKTNLLDEFEKLNKAVHADVTAAVEHDPRNPPAKEPKEIESFYDLKDIKPALFQTIVTSGFDRPSPVQARALPIAFSGRNLVAQAPSGTGKTITFTLSLLQNIDETKNYPQAVVISPTLDLAHAIHRVVSVYADALGMKTQLVIKEMTSLKYKNAQVIVGTPGKLTSCFRRAGPMFIDPSRISVFVLDEADKMLQSNGLGNETRRVLACCKNIKQFILCSATFQKSVLDFAIGPNKGIIKGPWSMVKIVPRGSGKCAIPKTIRHFFFMLKDGGRENKIEALLTLYSVITVGQSFVFTNTKAAVKEISNRMNKEGMHSVALSGELTMEQRMEMFRQFHALEKRICVSTNVGSRGLDITGCTTVINFDIPYEDVGQTIPDVPTYVHRAGRSGRYGRNGICVTIVTSRKEYEDMKKIFDSCVSTDGVEIQWDEWSLEGIEEMEEQVARLAE